MIHLKANILQEIAKAMLREAEEIVWFFMQWPIHRSRQNQDAAVLEQAKSFLKEPAMVSNVLDHLSA